MIISLNFLESDVYEFSQNLFNRKQLRRFYRQRKLAVKTFIGRHSLLDDADDLVNHIHYNPVASQIIDFSFRILQKKFSAHHTFPLGI